MEDVFILLIYRIKKKLVITVPFCVRIKNQISVRPLFHVSVFGLGSVSRSVIARF